MKLALALALAPGVYAQQQHMLRGAQGPAIALDRFAGFDTGAGPLSDAERPAAARTLGQLHRSCRLCTRLRAASLCLSMATRLRQRHAGR